MAMVIINSELLEEKIEFIHKTDKLLNDLYSQLIQIQKRDIVIYEEELHTFACTIKNMLETTEKMDFILKNFMTEIDCMMVNTHNELDELKRVIAELFI